MQTNNNSAINMDMEAFVGQELINMINNEAICDHPGHQFCTFADGQNRSLGRQISIIAWSSVQRLGF